MEAEARSRGETEEGSGAPKCLRFSPSLSLIAIPPVLSFSRSPLVSESPRLRLSV